MEKDRESLLKEENFQEEAATEISPRIPADLTDQPIDEVQEGAGFGTTLGIIGLVLSLLSLFTLPFFLSLIGIGVGFFAYRRDAVRLGKWAIGIGLISLIGSMLFAPFLG